MQDWVFNVKIRRMSNPTNNSKNNAANINILLGVCGGIAAYKSADIIRRLQEQGASVRVVMTESAEQFIGKVTLQALSGYPVYQNMFVSDNRVMEHIDLARWADKILLAPATANSIAKIANGQADDMISTLCLAADCPVYIAPSMNHAMWDNPATQNNINTLIARGIHIISPDTGDQACGETGEGRLKETHALVIELLSDSTLLAGKKVLITAGPTREAIDPVRYISNHSSGKMGYALAQRARLAGAEVYLISGPSTLSQPAGIHFVSVTTAAQMHHEVTTLADKTDIFIGAAAVADYRPEAYADHKIKKTSDKLKIKLVKNPDILADVASMSDSPFCVGFAAETENLEENAKIKLTRKKLDMIIANQVGKSATGNDVGFNSNKNTVTVLTENKTIQFSENSKTQLAKQLIQLIAETYDKKHSS